MNPTIKYKLNQRVYINSQTKIKPFSCQAVKIVCKYEGYSASEWGEAAMVIGKKPTGGYPFRIFYSESSSPKDDQWVSEELLFETQEELIESIKIKE